MLSELKFYSQAKYDRKIGSRNGQWGDEAIQKEACWPVEGSLSLGAAYSFAPQKYYQASAHPCLHQIQNVN